MSSLCRTFADLERCAPDVLAQHAVPGAAVVAVDGRGEVFCRGFGTRDVAGRLPVGVDTRFGTASLTKTMSAVVAGTLVRDGLLAWDAPVSRLLPGFRLCDAMASARCTLRDLLLHRSGIPAGNLVWLGRELDEDAACALLEHIPPGREFRTAWQFQDLNYAAVAKAMRAVSGRTWHELIRERLIGPVGMSRACTTVEGMTSDDDYARPSGPNGFQPPRELPPLRLHGLSAAEAVNCSIRDIGRYLRAMIGEPGDALPPEAIAACTEPHLPRTAGPWSEMLMPMVGFGWTVAAYRGEICWFCTGGINGYVSHCFILPRRGLASAALANRAGTAVAHLLAVEALDRAAGFEPLPWRDRLTEHKRGLRAAAAERRNRRRARIVKSAGRPPARYAGEYGNGPYGYAHVAVEGRRLSFRYHSARGHLAPYGGDSFGLFDGDEEIELDVDFRLDTDRGTLLAPIFHGVPPVALPSA